MKWIRKYTLKNFNYHIRAWDRQHRRDLWNKKCMTGT